MTFVIVPDRLNKQERIDHLFSRIDLAKRDLAFAISSNDHTLGMSSINFIMDCGRQMQKEFLGDKP